MGRSSSRSRNRKEKKSKINHKDNKYRRSRSRDNTSRNKKRDKDKSNKKTHKYRKRSYSRSSSKNKKNNEIQQQYKKNSKLSDIPNQKQKNEEIDEKKIQLDNQEEDQILNEDQLMLQMMGFTQFNSTKNQDHTESAVEAVRKNKQQQRKYRQYMNRRGGFNRELSPV